MAIANITVWSNTGQTPITNRGGLYCDVVAKISIEVADPGEAKAKAQKLIADTPYGHYAYYDVPGWWNHNTRSGWTHAR